MSYLPAQVGKKFGSQRVGAGNWYLPSSQPGRGEVEATSSESFPLQSDGKRGEDTTTALREGVKWPLL